ncbi:VOC family protein [Ornithinicoccus halotolerans]|uniref:VOC family protein n=1 Tax=Ornithinicoccus halotolerans TaxID=1748220 RepID=UPI001E5E805D|nr:VOC family protein [Ornithinicoccus halotolerans]
MSTATAPSGYQQMIFVNLPVQDVAAARRFWEGLGYAFSEEFREDNTAECLQISDTIFAMLLSREFYATFTDKPVHDPRQASAALLCLSAPSREAVDTLVDGAVAAGATEPRPAMADGPMYSRSFDDPDGHTWEVLHMDPAAVEPEPADAQAPAATG